jgi:hypothetical protein
VLNFNKSQAKRLNLLGIAGFLLYSEILGEETQGLVFFNNIGTVPTNLFALFTSQKSIKFLQKS